MPFLPPAGSFPCPSGGVDSLLQHFAVQLISYIEHVARLLRTQKIAGATEAPDHFMAILKPGAKLCEFLDGTQPLFRDLGERSYLFYTSDMHTPSYPELTYPSRAADKAAPDRI